MKNCPRNYRLSKSKICRVGWKNRDSGKSWCCSLEYEGKLKATFFSLLGTSVFFLKVEWSPPSLWRISAFLKLYWFKYYLCLKTTHHIATSGLVFGQTSAQRDLDELIQKLTMAASTKALKLTEASSGLVEQDDRSQQHYQYLQCRVWPKRLNWLLLWFPYPGDLPNPGIEPRSPALQADSLTAEPQGKPKNTGAGSLAYPFSRGSSKPKNRPGVSCIAGGSEMKWSEVAQLCPTLCDPMDCSLPGFSVHGIFQGRILEWVAISFSRGSSWPRDRTQDSHSIGRCFTIWATREVTSWSYQGSPSYN